MNEDKRTTEYLKKLRAMKLSEASRSRIAGELEQYAEFHGAAEGVREEGEVRSIGQVPQSTSLIQRLIPKRNMTSAILTLALIFGIGGGTSYAAEGAVPGDVLYPVKVDINERVKSALAISAESEATLQARLAAERLEEAEELAARGQLDADTASNISLRLNQHVEAANEESAASESDGDYETAAAVRASLAGTLNTYNAILSRLDVEVSGNDGDSLISNIRARAAAAAEAENDAAIRTDASVESDIDVEALIKRADEYVASVGGTLVRAESELSATVYGRMRAHLAGAIEAVAEAKADLRSGLYREAYQNAQKAIRIAQETKTMLSSALRLNVDWDLSTYLLDLNTDVRSETGSGEDSDTEDSSDSSTDRASDNSNNSSDTSTRSNVEVDTSINSNVDTDVIDADTSTDSSVRLSI